MPRKATLTRLPSTEDGTFGNWRSDTNFHCVTLEKPDRGNQAEISCIPLGEYDVKWLWSPHHNCELYHVLNVPGRSDIEIHAANIEAQLRGCIAPGAAITLFSKGGLGPDFPAKDVKGLVSSKNTLAWLEKDMRDPQTGEQLPFRLSIVCESKSLL